MDGMNPSIETTVMLIRIANIISPIHAKAVSEYIARFTDAGCSCPNCQEVYGEVIQSIITNLDDLAILAGDTGGGVTIMPVTEEAIVKRDAFLNSTMRELAIVNCMFLPKRED